MTQTIYLDAQNCKIKLYFPLYISNWQELELQFKLVNATVPGDK